MGEYTPKGQGNLNTVLGAIGTLGAVTDPDGIFGGMFGGRRGYRDGYGYGDGHGYDGHGRGKRDCDCYVTEKELCLTQQVNAEKSKVAELIAEKYADNKLAIVTEKFENKIDKLNEKFEGKFDYLLQKEVKLEGDLATECERRACGDENIVNYVNGNFVKNTKVVNGSDIWYNNCKPILRACNPCGDSDDEKTIVTP